MSIRLDHAIIRPSQSLVKGGGPAARFRISYASLVRSSAAPWAPNSVCVANHPPGAVAKHCAVWTKPLTGSRYACLLVEAFSSTICVRAAERV